MRWLHHIPRSLGFAFDWPGLDLRCLEFWFGLGIGASAALGVWGHYQ